MQAFFEEGRITKQGSSAIKGFAILLMLIHHTVLRLEGINYTAILPTGLIDLIGSMGRLCVPLFVFVTGYGLLYKEITYKDTPKRIMNIWTTYFICFIAVVIIMMFLGDLPKFSIRNTLGDIFGLQRIISYEYTGLLSSWWYITTAFLLVMIAPVWVQLVKKYGVGLFVLTLFLPAVFHMTYTGDDLLFLWLPIYTLGMLVAYYKPTLSKLTSCKGLTAFGMLFGASAISVVIYYICIKLNQGFLYIRMWLPVVFLIVVIYFLCRIQWVFRILVWFGGISFPIYCIHTLFLNLPSIMNLAQCHWLLPTFVALVLSILLALPINRLAKHITNKI